MRKLRDYQLRAVRRVGEEWEKERAVCLVAPTGSGKTTMGVELVKGHDHVVWVAHRRELVAQAVERLQSEGLHVGALCPGLDEDEDAPVQVGTIQTLLAGGHAPPADLVVFDEAHHHAPGAKYWHGFQEQYQDARFLGLTATPERQDGSPLGNVFGALVEAASYSELIEAGHLVDCHVYRAPKDEVQNGWAQTPLEAYQESTPDGRGFAFYARVSLAETWARQFTEAGIPSAVITGKTPKDEREQIVESLRDGSIKMIHNVSTMTEGVDVPVAEVCIITQLLGSSGGYLQRVGRVLRPAEDKGHATLLDLVGISYRYGLPTADRVYTLDGKKGIHVAEKTTTRTCLGCGHRYARSLDSCPRCGLEAPKPKPVEIRIYSSKLRRVYAGADTADEHKRSEYQRLRRLATSRGWGLGWVAKEYGKLFDSRPSFSDVSPIEWEGEYRKTRAFGDSRGYKPGWAAFRVKDLMGRWPPRAWVASYDESKKRRQS